MADLLCASWVVRGVLAVLNLPYFLRLHWGRFAYHYKGVMFALFLFGIALCFEPHSLVSAFLIIVSLFVLVFVLYLRYDTDQALEQGDTPFLMFCCRFLQSHFGFSDEQMAVVAIWVHNHHQSAFMDEMKQACRLFPAQADEATRQRLHELLNHEIERQKLNKNIKLMCTNIKVLQEKHQQFFAPIQLKPLAECQLTNEQLAVVHQDLEKLHGKMLNELCQSKLTT